MSQRIVVDPVTRIEGHLRIEVEVENGRVKNAWSSGTMFRGIELILQDRDPRDAWLFTQRACGVCTYVHGLASVRCVEDALNLRIPDTARILRNLMLGVQHLHDHLVHFYVLHALDWVDIVNALQADPRKTAELAEASGKDPSATPQQFEAVQKRLKAFVESGQLGPFADAYWGHPAYRLPPEANLMASKHYLDALAMQVRIAQMHAIFGGKNPHLQSLTVGGVTCEADVTVDRVARFLYQLKEAKKFIDGVYVPDLLAIAGFYKDWGSVGGTRHFLAYGDFPQNSQEPESLFLPRGIVFMRDLSRPRDVDLSKISEHVRHSWYETNGHNGGVHPSEEETRPRFTGLDTGDRYSWIKAPRYNGDAMEVGPLARVLVAYAKGHPRVKKAVDRVLKNLDVPPSALFSTLGRTAARAIVTQVLAEAMVDWTEELIERLRKRDTATYVSYEMKDGVGVGLNDVPRGSLGHWIEIRNKKIRNYQMIVPSTWNLGPRCTKDVPGPVEEALVGTPVADPRRPVEILRTVHSFDPCIACAVHVIDPHTNEVYKVRVL